MANQFRYVRGDTNALALPKYASDAVEIGDLLFWDDTNNAVRPATNITGTDYPTKQGNFAAAFIGVALEAKAAGASGNILVATSGDFVYACPSGAEYEVRDYVAIGDGTAVANQTVVKDATASKAIGRVTASKASTGTTVTIRLLSKLNVA